jgi:hypothetical protein
MALQPAGSSHRLSPFHPYRLRKGLEDLIRQQSVSHAMTLITNRDVTLERMTAMFGQFCFDVDRYFLKRRAVEKLPSGERFFAVAVPENLATNPHLHVAARLHGWVDHFDAHDEQHLCGLWEDITGEAGELDLREIYDRWGWSKYITKQLIKNDWKYILSSDFHPNLSVLN